MKPQIYNFDTRFNFGKHKGRSLTDILRSYESKYIGDLIANDILWFILDIETMNFLEKNGFLDDLNMSANISGGSISLSDIGLKKEDVLNILKKRYDDFMRDPIAYEKLARENYQNYLKGKESTHRKHSKESERQFEDNGYEDKEPIHFGSPQDPGENPWLDILPDDEADAAYWNTQ